MCAILDANLVTVVFGAAAPHGAKAFRRWLDSGRGRLAVGGVLRRERSSNRAFGLWLQEALRSGRAKNVSDHLVDRQAEELRAAGTCRSNDEHVVALARVSGARLLYSRDQMLREDFKNTVLIHNPRGKIYPESEGRAGRQWLLNQRDLCAD